jgi:hypothetical protein
MLTNHTIGGTTIVPRVMRFDNAEGRTEIRGREKSESEEDFLTYHGIMLTTNYSVTRDDEESGKRPGSKNNRKIHNHGWPL